MTAVTLRKMNKDDISAVMAIEASSFETPWTAGILRDELAAQNRTYLVAEEAGRSISGYAGLMVVGQDAHITTIAVLDAMRGRGIGTRIMVALIDAALSEGARHLTLEVRASNTTAQGMYERFGFANVGRRKNYYRTEDAVVMWATNIDSVEYTDLLAPIRAGLEAVA